MRNYLFALLIAIMALTSLSSVKYDGFDTVDPIVFSVDEQFEKKLNDEYNKSIYKSFLNKLGHLESSNNYKAVNGSYYGKYQFGELALKDVGFDHVDTHTFLNNPEYQEEAMKNWLRINKMYLQRYIDKYAGEKRNGIFITEAGILASAHLGGSGSVKIWFDTGRVFRDGNGTPITKYMKAFEELDEFKFKQ